MSIKRMMCVMLAFGISCALSACGKTADQPAPQSAAEQNQNSPATATATPATDNMVPTVDTDAQNTAGAVLQQLNLKDGESPVIRGVALDGNRAGRSIDAGGHINGREISDHHIRNIFELNEWISFRLDTDQKSGLSATIFPHQDDPASITESFLDQLPDSSPCLELNPPGSVDSHSWGGTYLDVEDWKPGDYDLVFLSGPKPVARIQLKFYAEDELSTLSDDQLEKMMQNQ